MSIPLRFFRFRTLMNKPIPFINISPKIVLPNGAQPFSPVKHKDRTTFPTSVTFNRNKPNTSDRFQKAAKIKPRKTIMKAIVKTAETGLLKSICSNSSTFCICRWIFLGSGNQTILLIINTKVMMMPFQLRLYAA